MCMSFQNVQGMHWSSALDLDYLYSILNFRRIQSGNKGFCKALTSFDRLASCFPDAFELLSVCLPYFSHNAMMKQYAKADLYRKFRVRVEVWL
jgi:hypothetical protein